MNTIVIERTEHGEYPIDIFTKLVNERILFINSYINDRLATDLCATMLLKDMENDKEKMSLYINAEKGDIRSVFMIYDTMKLISSPIETVCFGMAMNEVVLLLSGGTKGMRYATENSMIVPGQLINDESYYSNLVDAKSVLDRTVKDNKDFMKALSSSTGKKLSKLMKDFERKQFLTAKQAKEYGLIDEIVKKSKK